MNKNLPTINELYADKEIEILDKQNKLNVLLNQSPKQDWVKYHPIIKDLKYIPIERINWLITNIFIEHRIEVLETKILANSVAVTVRLHVKNPVTGEWTWQDGVGAVPLQTDKDASPVDWNHLKADAVMKALPAAKSFAVKDAAEELGKLFGRDLNRKEDIVYNSLLNKFVNHDAAEQLKEEIANMSKEELLSKAEIIRNKYIKAGMKKNDIEIIITNELKNK